MNFVRFIWLALSALMSLSDLKFVRTNILHFLRQQAANLSRFLSCEIPATVKPEPVLAIFPGNFYISVLSFYEKTPKIVRFRGFCAKLL